VYATLCSRKVGYVGKPGAQKVGSVEGLDVVVWWVGFASLSEPGIVLDILRKCYPRHGHVYIGGRQIHEYAERIS
jgi:hypothetical protein